MEKEAEENLRIRKEKKENLRKRKQNAKAPEKTDEELRGYSVIQARELTEDDCIKPVSQKVKAHKKCLFVIFYFSFPFLLGIFKWRFLD